MGSGVGFSAYLRKFEHVAGNASLLKLLVHPTCFFSFVLVEFESLLLKEGTDG